MSATVATGAVGAATAAVATGALVVVSLPPIASGNLGWLAWAAWIAFWPLLAACRGRSWLTRLALGCVSGLTFGAGTVGLWLLPAARAHLAADAPSAAALTLAAAWIYGGVYLALLALIHPWIPRPRALVTAAVWVLLEWVRGFALGGAPWALLGHSQHDSALAQVAELGGVPILSFLLMLTSAALAERGRERSLGLTLALALAAAGFAFGWARLRDLPLPQDECARCEVAVMALSGHHLAADPLAQYVEATEALSRHAALRPGRGAAGDAIATSTIVVWPEGATPGYLDEEPAARAAIARAARGHAGLLLGARRYLGTTSARRYFNSVFAIASGPPVVAEFVADKQRLVPLAEAAPWPFPYELPQPFSPAPELPEPVALAGLRLGPLICWDVLFDDVARTLVSRGADLLVNLSSDRDLGAGAEQLVVFARFRAIETRRWLLRASGVGRSLAIDPAGRILDRDRVRLEAGVERPRTWFVRHGGLVPLAAACIVVLALALEARRRTRVGAVDSSGDVHGS